MFQTKMAIIPTWSYGPYVARKQTMTLRRTNLVLDSSKAKAALTPFLSEIAQDFLSEDESGPAVDNQLAEFVDNLRSKKLSDSRFEIFASGKL